MKQKNPVSSHGSRIYKFRPRMKDPIRSITNKSKEKVDHFLGKSSALTHIKSGSYNTSFSNHDATESEADARQEVLLSGRG